MVSGTPILSTTATIASPNGQYPIAITVGTLSAANYDFITVDGTLTVADTPATTITLTATPGSTSTYGQALTFTATVSPTVDRRPDADRHRRVRDRRQSHRLSRSRWSTARPRATSLSSPSAGVHTIEAIYSGDGFYATNSQTVTQTVTPAPLTITADNQTKVYGAALPTLTASYTGFVNGDTSASLTTQPTLSTTATVSSHVAGSPYAITATGAVDTNYTISYVAGQPHRHPGAADDHRRQPDQGLRRGAADAHRLVLGLRQRRHRGQPDHPAHADDDRHRQQPRRHLHHHRQRRRRSRLHDHLCRRHADRHPGGLDDHRRQPDQGLRRALPTLTAPLLRLRQWRHLGQPDHPAHADDDGHRQQPCRGQPLRHHRQRRGRSRLLDHATSRAASPSPPRR